MRILAAIVVVFAVVGCTSSGPAVPRWGVYETSLTSDRDYANSLRDVDVKAQLTSPSGKTRRVDAFWDGQRTWKLRVSPDEPGRWAWRLTSSDPANAGLNDKSGVFTCTAATSGGGPLRVAPSGSHLTHADGKPFYFLADTAWNGALRSSEADWSEYLAARKEQRFNVIQFVTTQWRGGNKLLDEPVFIGKQNISVNPAAFARVEARLRAIVEHGMVPAPVMLWALQKDDPGQYLSEDDAIRLARYMKARWSAYHPVWLLNGDGKYNDDIDRWTRIGRAVFSDSPDELATMHPSGQHWVAENFKDEKWYDFIGYQSGHGSSDGNLKWLTTGTVAQAWRKLRPYRPIINLEPNYEGHPSYQGGQPFGDREVRRAAYWSQLVAPPAGVTYGNNPIWVWNTAGPAEGEGHSRLGVIGTWRTGMNLPGIQSMTLMREFFESGPWWQLRPAPELIHDNPGDDDPRKFIAAASGRDWTVIYIPSGGAVTLNKHSPTPRAQWFNPRTGQYTPAVAQKLTNFKAPDAQNDWVLSIR